ncbi:MAG: DUF2093 domain-containing protein [Pseudomonadota bacterium]
MNRFQSGLRPAKEAKLDYLPADYHVVSPGSYVRCAVTGVPIPLDELKYWSVELQEAYVNPDAVVKRLNELGRV